MGISVVRGKWKTIPHHKTQICMGIADEEGLIRKKAGARTDYKFGITANKPATKADSTWTAAQVAEAVARASPLVAVQTGSPLRLHQRRTLAWMAGAAAL